MGHWITTDAGPVFITKGEGENAGKSLKAQIAAASYKKANKDEQRYGEAQEAKLAKKLSATYKKGAFAKYSADKAEGNAVQSDDSKPFDVTRKSGGRTHGIEVKTKINSANTDTGNRVWMKEHALSLKDDWMNQQGHVGHTVVFDHRDRAVDAKGGFIGNKAAWSGHELYYKRGVGKYRLGSMYKCKDTAELNKLIDMPDSALPKAARAGKR